MRLPPRPGEVIDRDAPVRFYWNKRPIDGYAGDTIASALAAAGVRYFSRSLKYHRKRGLLSADYHDTACVVQVGAEPNVRGAHRLIASDMDVRAQNVWPRLSFDVKAVNQLAARFLPAGFYYKTFMKPRFLWPAYQKVLRRFSPGGTVAAHPAALAAAKRFAHPDVLVAGGGPAGMAAALAASAAGARVMLVDEQHLLGGHLLWSGEEDRDMASRLRERLAASDVEVLSDAVVAGRYDDNWIAVVAREADGGERLIKARAGALVVACGLLERPYVLAGNDLVGVMLSTAVRRMINMYAVKPGKRAVVLSANTDGDAAAEDLRRADVEVAHVADARAGDDVVRVLGRGRKVRGVELRDGRRIACDLFVTATGWTAPTSLLNMAGDNPIYDAAAARFRPDIDNLPDNVLAAGGILGDGSTAELSEHGRQVGELAARRARGEAAGPAPQLEAAGHPQLYRSSTHGMVDFSEDVSSKDIYGAVAEGYRSVELAKRYTTATMGPAQGKFESVNATAIVAEATDSSIADTGTTTWRPPYTPITLGALAGRHRDPARRSPMHSWHVERGATMLVAGDWIRPEHYGDPQTEARQVRQGVGIIDVTPIGKIDLRGADVPRLLNLVYLNKWSKLEVGRVRYGAMCGEDGVVLDDGVTGRLGERHYLMSTTSTGSATVTQWLEMWLQTEHPDWDVHVTPLTSAYASINVAGPRSRELLSRLVTDVDLSNEEFGYMRVRRGTVAGVADCVLWRIGFTGELSYELHIPAGYGPHVWRRLLEAGHDLDVTPFGVEAQRVLRLEKGHLIVGQDTDGLTTAVTAGLEGLIKFDKTDFAGMPELRIRAARSGGTRLVGLAVDDESVVPDEGCQLLDDNGDIRGRVTSSRMSPTLRRAVCLGHIDDQLATAGAEVSIRLTNGRLVRAEVTEHLAAVDPEGSRLRA